MSGIALEIQRALSLEYASNEATIIDIELEDGCEILQYISGLWVNDLAYGLIWQKATRKRPKGVMITPTWSWQSILGKVEWPPRKQDLRSEISISKLDYENYQALDIPTIGKGKAADRGLPKLLRFEVYKSPDSELFYLPSFRSSVRFDANSVCGRITLQAKKVELEVTESLPLHLVEQAAIGTGIETPTNIEELQWSGILLSDGSSEEVIGWGSFERGVDEQEALCHSSSILH